MFSTKLMTFFVVFMIYLMGGFDSFHLLVSQDTTC